MPPIICPNCKGEHKDPLARALADGSKELLCNVCWIWFLMTKDGKVIAKPKGSPQK